jgi:hypothetical protein
MRFDSHAIDVPRMLAELGIEVRHVRNAWVGKCPTGDHEDRHPSWEIIDEPGSEKHSLHLCRSCHFGGTAVELVRRHFGLAGTREAVAWLQENAMGTPATLERLTVRVRSAARPELKMPGGVMFGPVGSWPSVPRRYLLEDRRVSVWQVERWGIGYAVDGEQRGRIVFPARDNEGRLLNFTGRTFVNSMVRYKSAPESANPDTAAIFGELHWPRIDAPRDTVWVCEGALNALAVEVALSRWDGGEKPCLFPAIASLFGSKVQLEQILKIASFRRAVILTDPDLAGEEARDRMGAALGRHIKVWHAYFPTGQDAASVGTERLREILRACSA